MKRISIMMACVGLAFISYNASAGVAQFKNAKTTCYVFKNNKLAKKSACTYSGSAGGGNTPYVVFVAEFEIKGYGIFDVVDNASGDAILDDGSWLNPVYTTKLNGKKAIYRVRDVKTLKVLPEKVAEQRDQAWVDKGNALGWKNVPLPNYMKCYKIKSSALEMCYIEAELFG